MFGNKLFLMDFDYDILIAGAGPAGCAAAYDLVRAGRRVLLLDKRAFPRPKACACGLTRKTLSALRYSVDPVIERVCHEIVLQNGNNPGVPHLASEPQEQTTHTSQEARVRTRRPIAAMAVRERFDAFCLQQTLAAGRDGGGAVLKKIESIVAIEEHPTHIALTLATANGTETLTAPVLLGADGSNGQTRRLTAQNAEPTWYTKGFALEACVPYTALPAQLPGGDRATDLVFDFAPLPGGYGWLFPKGDHINIGVGAFAPARDEAPDFSHLDAELGVRKEPDLRSVTRELLADYTQRKLGVSLTALHAPITGQHLGMGGQHYVPRGRVLLVGDAAGLVDPLTGEGIHSAIVSGQAAAAAILEEETEFVAATDLASAYAHRLRPLQQTLAFSARAARAFYRSPERGLRAMRNPLLRPLILKTYADGFPYPRLITALARFI